MISSGLKPWGEISWLLSKCENIEWSILGCLSSEDRCLGTINYLNNLNLIKESLFIEIKDPPSLYSELIEAKTENNRKLFLELGRQSVELVKLDLFTPHHRIIETLQVFLQTAGKNIIIDISSFPKRYFFPLLKILIKSDLENLIVTYSTPLKYSEDDLSGNPDPWSHLPLFMPVDYPEKDPELAIVGVGFMPFGLPTLLHGSYKSIPVKFLFPFPPGPPNYQRAWEFVRKIKKSFTFKASDGIIRVASNNVPDAFNYLLNVGERGKKNTILAPYGPKPISLAMCIYATLTDSLVYYTQPRTYNPEYSTGLRTTFGYLIKSNSTDLYKITDY